MLRLFLGHGRLLCGHQRADPNPVAQKGTLLERDSLALAGWSPSLSQQAGTDSTSRVLSVRHAAGIQADAHPDGPGSVRPAQTELGPFPRVPLGAANLVAPRHENGRETLPFHDLAP